jgi:hypothetical protein
MRKAEARGWTKVSAPCYVEKHHPFIRAIFGENNRVVYLTAREHVLAHLLLFKACLDRYGRHHRKTWKAATAATAMGMLSKHTWQRTLKSCSTLGLAREVDAENKKIKYTGVPQGPKPGSSRPGMSNHFYGKTHTEETCQVISERGVGRVWWHNPETGEITTSHSCPGTGWKRGRPLLGPHGKPCSESKRKNCREKNTGLKYYNNGVENKKFRFHPGGDWVPGMKPRNN